VTERKTTEELAALLAGVLNAGLPVPRESSTLEMKAAFMLWRHNASQADYRGIQGFGVFPFDLPEVGSEVVAGGFDCEVIASRWGRRCEGDHVEYDMIVRRGRKKEKSMTTKYGASVRFTDHDIPEVYVEEDSPDKARTYALQKAKLTGNEPELVNWATDDGDQVMLWPSQERMSVQAYNERFPDDVRFRDPETL
jgi:hypothetical protein